MRNFLMLFSVFALLVSLTASLVHAENHCEDGVHASVNCGSEHIEEQSHNKTSSGECCDMACGGCAMHHHNHFMSSKMNEAFLLSLSGMNRIGVDPNQLHVSGLIYGLKRPPKA